MGRGEGKGKRSPIGEPAKCGHWFGLWIDSEVTQCAATPFI